MYSDASKLTIGYYVDDGFFDSVPAMRRGVMETVEKLRQKGHTVKEWKLPRDFMLRAGSLFMSVILGDEGQSLRDLLKDDEIDRTLAPMLPLVFFPKFLKRAIGRVVGFFGRLVSFAALYCY